MNLSFINVTMPSGINADGVVAQICSSDVGTATLGMKDFITRICTQINSGYVYAILLIFTFYIMKISILPRAVAYMEKNNPAAVVMFKMIAYDWLLEMLELASLMSCLYLLWVANVQFGFNGFQKFWLGTLALIVLGGLINNGYLWYRGRNRNGKNPNGSKLNVTRLKGGKTSVLQRETKELDARTDVESDLFNERIVDADIREDQGERMDDEE